jgi:O-antigen/teichoic acid export membrane protein
MLKRILQGMAWNLGGFVTPAIVALGSVPVLIHLIGEERFGVLSLAWAVIGMFSFLDLGLGRALTLWIAELLGGKRNEELPSVVSSTMTVALAISISLGTLTFVVVTVRGRGLTATSPALATEVLVATQILALGITLAIYGAVLRGALEGYSDFRTVNLVKIPMGVAMFALPCVTGTFTTSLPIAIAAIVIARAIGNAVMAHQLFRRVSYSPLVINFACIHELIQHGGWITVSNIVSPLIVYVDRFMIGAIMTASAVTYYTVPADALSRIVIIPVSLASVLFPMFASKTLSKGSNAQLLIYSTLAMAIVVVPIVLCAIAFAGPILHLWVGSEFELKSTRVFQVLAIAFGFNAMAQVPFLALQAMGRSKVVALSHLVQLPVFAIVAWFTTVHWGILGTATAWSCRVLLDTSLLYYLLVRTVSSNGSTKLLPV